MLANNAISISFTLYDIIMAILAIAGIVALVFLAKLLVSVSKITDSIGKTLNDNKPSIDEAIKDLPRITTNLTGLLDNTNSLVADVKPSVVSLLTDVNNVTNKISNVTTNVSDTVEVVGLAAADTASRFTSTVSNATDYLALAKGILSYFNKKRR